MRSKLLGSALAAALSLWTSAAMAAEVKMGIRTDPSSIDPHYHVYTPNSAVWRHIFDALTWTDSKTRLQPGLAVSHKPIGEDIWEFKLRPNVTFHDGTPFTAEDVVFSLNRAPNVPKSRQPEGSSAPVTKARSRARTNFPPPA